MRKGGEGFKAPVTTGYEREQYSRGEKVNRSTVKLQGKLKEGDTIHHQWKPPQQKDGLVLSELLSMPSALLYGGKLPVTFLEACSGAILAYFPQSPENILGVFSLKQL